MRVSQLKLGFAISFLAIGCNIASPIISGPGPVSRVAIFFTPISKQIHVGEAAVVNSVGYDSNDHLTTAGSISYSSSDPSIARVDPGADASHRNVIGLAPGKVIISVIMDGVLGQDALTVIP